MTCLDQLLHEYFYLLSYSRQAKAYSKLTERIGTFVRISGYKCLITKRKGHVSLQSFYGRTILIVGFNHKFINSHFFSVEQNSFEQTIYAENINNIVEHHCAHIGIWGKAINSIPFLITITVD